MLNGWFKSSPKITKLSRIRAYILEKPSSHTSFCIKNLAMSKIFTVCLCASVRVCACVLSAFAYVCKVSKCVAKNTRNRVWLLKVVRLSVISERLPNFLKGFIYRGVKRRFFLFTFFFSFFSFISILTFFYYRFTC